MRQSTDQELIERPCTERECQVDQEDLPPLRGIIFVPKADDADDEVCTYAVYLAHGHKYTKYSYQD